MANIGGLSMDGRLGDLGAPQMPSFNLGNTSGGTSSTSSSPLPAGVTPQCAADLGITGDSSNVSPEAGEICKDYEADQAQANADRDSLSGEVDQSSFGAMQQNFAQ